MRKEIAGEEKLQLTEACLRGEMRISEAARRAGVHVSNVYKWISQYRAEGAAAFQRKGRRVYSPEIKQMAIVVYDWIKKYQALGIAGLEDRRGQRTVQQIPRTPEEELRVCIAQLERENYLLRLEREQLKK